MGLSVGMLLDCVAEGCIDIVLAGSVAYSVVFVLTLNQGTLTSGTVTSPETLGIIAIRSIL